MTRRDALKGAVGLAALGALPASAAGSGGPRSRRERVAIIGGGAGGVAAAYFLAGSFDVDLFEARSRIGGHCDSRVIKHQGRRITVDLGAQFFHPDTHPIYVTLLEELGLYDPEHPDGDATLEAPASLCIFRTAGGAPIFSSSHPLSTPDRAIDFAMFTQLARQAVLSDMSWEITVDDWIRSLPLRQSFKKDVLYPWISALIGSARADALRSSARSILQTFALAFPANIFEGATTCNSKIGLQGNLQRMLDCSPTAHVHLGSACAGPESQTRRLVPGDAGGSAGTVSVRGAERATACWTQAAAFAPRVRRHHCLLDVYEYFDSRLVVHTDAAYVHRDRRNWGVYNAGVNGPNCEGSVWLGALNEKSASGATVDVFKSWAERRRADPTHILLERRFKHPLISRSTIRAARALRPLQGRNGLYFTGQYTTGFDLQESALYSAIKVAEALAPDSRTLASLNTRLSARGRTGISYDL